MSNSFGFLDIILLAMFAGFILLRLRNILGRKTGYQGKSRNKYFPGGIHTLKDLENKLTEFFSYLIKNNKLNNIYSKYFRDNTHTFVGTKIFLNDYLNIFPKYEFQ